MALGSKTELIRQAFLYLFGEGYENRLTKFPEDEVFPQTIKHFDQDGLHYLNSEVQTVQVSNGQSEAQVTVSCAMCHLCGSLYGKVEDIHYVLEYQPTQSGQALIRGLNLNTTEM